MKDTFEFLNQLHDVAYSAAFDIIKVHPIYINVRISMAPPVICGNFTISVIISHDKMKPVSIERTIHSGYIEKVSFLKEHVIDDIKESIHNHFNEKQP